MEKLSYGLCSLSRSVSRSRISVGLFIAEKATTSVRYQIEHLQFIASTLKKLTTAFFTPRFKFDNGDSSHVLFVIIFQKTC